MLTKALYIDINFTSSHPQTHTHSICGHIIIADGDATICLARAKLSYKYKADSEVPGKTKQNKIGGR